MSDINLNTNVRVQGSGYALNDGITSLPGAMREIVEGARDHGKIDAHEEAQIDHLANMHQDNTLIDLQLKLLDPKTNGAPTADEMHKLYAVCDQFSPNELRQMQAKGLITQQEADLMIMAGGMKNAGVSEQDMGKALSNFEKLSPEDQKFALDTMSQRGVSHTATIHKHFRFLGIGKKDTISYSDKSTPATADQVRMAIFLKNASPEQLTGSSGEGVSAESNLQKFTKFDYDTSKDQIANVLSQIPDWNNLSTTEQTALGNMVNGMATGKNPDGSDMTPGDIPSPQDIHDKFANADPGAADPWNDTVALGTLMYQVLADRAQTQDQTVRGYAQDVQQKNERLKEMNNAMTAIRGAENSDGGIDDISKVSVDNPNYGQPKVDADGNQIMGADGKPEVDENKTMSLSDFCSQSSVGISIPQTSDGKLSSDQVDDLLTSMKNKTDTLTSDSQLAMTKLQQQMDKYNQCTSLLTGFESKWNQQMGSIIGNIR